MTRGNPAATLQKTYDDCHLVCSTAIYFESKKDEPEALRCWKNARDQIAYHNAVRLPSNYLPKTETERALCQSLRQLELQCRERIDLLEALDASRQEAAAGSGPPDNKPTDSAEAWSGMPIIPPLNYPDLAKPPPLPTRPLPLRLTSDSGGGIQRLIKTSSASPIHSSRTSRSPSPEKKMKLKSTLRPLRKSRTPSSTDARQSRSSVRPPAASKAATQAWATSSRPEGASTPLQSDKLVKLGSKTIGDEGVLGQLSPRYGSSAPPNSHNSRTSLLQPNTSDTSISQCPNEPEYSKFPTRSKKQRHTPTQPTEPLSATGYDKLQPPRSNGTINNSHKPQITRPSGPSFTSIVKHPIIDGVNKYNEHPHTTKTVSQIRRKPLDSEISKTGLHSSRQGPVYDDADLDNSDSESRSSDEQTELDELGVESKELSWLSTSAGVLSNLPRGVDMHAAEQILNEVVIQGDEVHWDDIAGLSIAKAALKENVVYPFLRPDLFRGLREPARGILLFGPPGTGKTMLARAVASESSSTFFAISASSLISKYLGESEKLVRALFTIAKLLAPSVIFVDEIDSLLSSRSESGEHETSRRIKTEFLIQWSDLARAAAGRESKSGGKLAETGDASRVLVLAATNTPWMIDEAARRRFVRRQYIPLPEADVRGSQIRTLLANQTHDLNENDVQTLIELTEGFSGSDITSLAKDAAMGPLRSLGERLLLTKTEDIRPISLPDFKASLLTIRPSVSKEGLQQFEDWAKQFGERGG